MPDPLIGFLKNRMDVLRLLGRIWQLLYIEGVAPDVGKRRENAIRLLLKEELGLDVNMAPEMERGWDFSIRFGADEIKYSLKTSEEIGVIKVAWNGFPSRERVERFTFENPILYVVRDKESNRISVCVFELDDLETVRNEKQIQVWWIPRSNTNPRGFGLSIRAVKELMRKAQIKGNFVFTEYESIPVESLREKYWKKWYELLKELASTIDGK